jgi:carboxylesterase type B
MTYLGVSHLSDIPRVFKQAVGYADDASGENIALSSEVSGSWAAFAVFEEPTHGPGTVAGWEAFKEDDEYCMQVIGGPLNGSRTIGKTEAQGGYENLAAKCAF